MLKLLLTVPALFFLKLLLLSAFYLLFTPIGILLRFTNKDPLSRFLDSDKPSYYIESQPLQSDSMTKSH